MLSACTLPGFPGVTVCYAASNEDELSKGGGRSPSGGWDVRADGPYERLVLGLGRLAQTT